MVTEAQLAALRAVGSAAPPAGKALKWLREAGMVAPKPLTGGVEARLPRLTALGAAVLAEPHRAARLRYDAGAATAELPLLPIVNYTNDCDNNDVDTSDGRS